MAEKLTADELLKMIADKEKAARNEGKEFPIRARILRKPERSGLGSIGPNPPIQIATFDDVRVEHLLAPEQWLPLFVGGGRYAIDIRTEENRTGFSTYIDCQFEGLPAKDINEIDLTILQRKDWLGPRVCSYPQPAVARAATTASVTPISFVAPSPGTSNGGAPPTASLGAVPATVPHYTQPNLVDVVTSTVNAATQQINNRIEEMRVNAEMRQRERDTREEADRRVAEAKAETQRVLDEMRAMRQTPVHAAGPSMTEIVTGVLTATAPIMKMFIDSQTERDRERREEQRRADEQRREDERRRDEARREDLKRADDDRRLFLEKLFAKPEISPEVKMLIDKTQDILRTVQESQQSPTEAAQQIMQLTSSVTSMGLQLIQQAQHAMGGEPDSPWVKVAEHVSNAVQAMVPNQQQTPRLPPRSAPTQQPTPGRGSLRIVEPTEVAPAPANIIDRIEQMIRAEEDVEKIAKFLIDNYDHVDVQEALTAHDGDLIAIMQPRLEDWATLARQPYLMSLFDAIDNAYKASGRDHLKDEADKDVVDSTGKTVQSPASTPAP